MTQGTYPIPRGGDMWYGFTIKKTMVHSLAKDVVRICYVCHRAPVIVQVCQFLKSLFWILFGHFFSIIGLCHFCQRAIPNTNSLSLKTCY